MARSDATPKVRVTRENLVALPALAPYFGFGFIAFVAVPFMLMYGTEALEAGFYRHPRVLAALHVAALGWGTAIALGALQQMTAVVGATELHSPRAAAAAFIPFGIGVIALVSGFYTFAPTAFVVAALGVPLGVLIVVWNVAVTMRTAQPTRRWILIEPFVKAAALYVLVAFIAGALLAVNLTSGVLGVLWNSMFPLHIGMAAGGWFLMLVIGISYHLLTFFGLTDKDETFQFTRAVRTMLHTGIVFGIVAASVSAPGAAVSDSVLAPIAMVFGAGGLLAVAVALGLFLWDGRGLYTRPARQRTTAVLTYVRLAHAYLALIVFFLVAGAVTNLVGPLQYVVFGIIIGAGWLSNTILGYLHRILAFFVWHNKYWGRGREPGVPAFRDMVNAPLSWAGLVVYNVGVCGAVVSVSTGVPIMWALFVWAAGALLAATNLIWTLLR